ncbi:hypothetical protein ACROYT_G043258 [Oculina patagonica]
MVNGDYWIYSDHNGQTILARCEESWQKINTEPVCFGARGNQHGAFNITKSGRIKTMKHIHKSGSIKCNPYISASYWGCRNSVYYGNNALLTIITNANKKAVLPPVEDLKAVSGNPDCGNTKHMYSLDGTHHTSPELVFPDLSNQLTVSRNQELQIWYGQDWIDCSEDNTGATCVDVYACNTSRNTNAEQKGQKVMSSFVKNDLIDKAQESTQASNYVAQESTQASNYVAQESSQGINDKAQESTQGSFNDGNMVLEAAKECVSL